MAVVVDRETRKSEPLCRACALMAGVPEVELPDMQEAWHQSGCASCADVTACVDVEWAAEPGTLEAESNVIGCPVCSNRRTIIGLHDKCYCVVLNVALRDVYGFCPHYTPTAAIKG